MKNVFISPTFQHEDNGDGGIRKIVEAMIKHLPDYDYNITNDIKSADIIHSHAGNLDTAPKDIPWIESIHGLYWTEYNWPNWTQKVNNNVINSMLSADAVTACSDWVANVLRRGANINPVVLKHGIEYSEWQNGTNEEYVFWDKAIKHAVSDPEVVNLLASRLPKIKFVSTYGNNTTNVEVIGRVPYIKARELTKNAGLYLATTRETFGISILQALAAGVPVVGFNWGGAKEIILPEVTGRLVTPGDFDALTDAVEWAFINRDKLSSTARADAFSRWQWNTAIKRYVELYDTLLGNEFSTKVSIVVPCYNLGKYLENTLESVLNQTFQSWECIIVDDASTDSSAEIANNYVIKDNRFKYLRNEANLHVAETRNRGFKIAQGEYFMALDADDALTSNALQILINSLDSDRSLGIVYGGLQTMSEAGELNSKNSAWPPSECDLKKQLNDTAQIPTNCLFRRAFFERSGGYRKRLSPSEDADLFARMVSIGARPAKVTEQTLFHYRIREQSISRTMPWQKWSQGFAWSKNRDLLPLSLGGPVQSYEPIKISVIIPVGPEHEKLVINAIDSVYAQTFQQWECIVVNDSGKTLENIPPWVILLNTEKIHSGPSIARNIGIHASKGRFFVPLDADDTLEPTALAELIKAYIPGYYVYSQWYEENNRVYDPSAYNPDLLVKKGCIHAITGLFAKKDWKTIGGYTDITHWEDWDFQLKLADADICGIKVSKPLFTYNHSAGFRRQDNLADLETGKQAILQNWLDVFNGERKLMACGSCGSRRPLMQPSPPVQSKSGINSNANIENMTLLEYTGTGGSRTFVGKSGIAYRFGADKEHRVRLVHNADVEFLLNLRGLFVATRISNPEPIGMEINEPVS